MEPASYLLALAKARDLPKIPAIHTLSSSPSLTSSAALSLFPLPSQNRLGINSRISQALLEIQLAEAILAERHRSTIKTLPVLPAMVKPSPWLVQSLFDVQAKTSAADALKVKSLPSESGNRKEVSHALKLAKSIPSLAKDDGCSSTGNSSSTASRSSLSSAGPHQEESIATKVFDIDVLCGRGGKSNHHPGNKRYREVISRMKSGYRQIGNKTAKTDLSRAIVDHVYQYGGRFLRYDKDTNKYIVLTPSEARKKTSQALREAKDVKWIS